ncbi:MAG: hypothetical protein J7M08_08415 [Planctomycetes bacterium]|nr:hypothetical protein [Planctomycetota bacterium]
MNDDKLLQGMLIAASVCLAFGIAMAWADISHYKGLPEPTSLPAVQSPQPAGQPETEAAQPADNLVALAPEGTVGVATVDVARLISRLEELQPAQSPPLPEFAKELSRYTIFFLAPAGDNPPGWCAAAKMLGTTKDALQEQISEKLEKVSAAGMDAFAFDTMAGMSTPPGAPPMKGLVAVVDDQTIIAADSAEQLEKIAAAVKSGSGAGPGSQLQELLERYSDRMVCFSAVIPAKAMEMMPPEAAAQMPDALKGLDSVAAGLDLAENFHLDVLMRMGEASQAQELAAEIRAGIDDKKQMIQEMAGEDEQMKTQLQPVLALLDKIPIQDSDRDLTLRFKCSIEELKAATGALMGMMMGGMMPLPGTETTGPTGGGAAPADTGDFPSIE